MEGTAHRYSRRALARMFKRPISGAGAPYDRVGNVRADAAVDLAAAAAEQICGRHPRGGGETGLPPGSGVRYHRGDHESRLRCRPAQGAAEGVMLPLQYTERERPRARKIPYGWIFVLATVLGATVLIPAGKTFQSVGLFGLLGVAYFLIVMDLRVGLGILVISAAVSPDITMAGLELRIEDFLIPVLCFAFFFRHVGRREALRDTLVGGPFALFLLLAIMSTLLGAISSSDEILRPGFFHTLKAVEYFVVFYLVVNAVRTLEDIKTLFLVLLAGSTLLLVYSYFQITSVVPGSAGRFSGPEGETSNIMGGYLLFHMLMVMGVLAVTNHPRIRLAGTIYVLVGLYPFLKTLSRTSYVAIAAAGIILSVLFKKRTWLVSLLLLGVLIYVFKETDVGTRAATLTSPLQDSSFQARMSAIQIESRNLMRSPLFGVGKGSGQLSDFDNEYLKVAVETGLLGLFLFLWILVRIYRATGRLIRLGEKHDNMMVAMGVGFLGGTIGLCIHALGATSFTTIRTMVPFYFMTGLVVAGMQILARLDEESRLGGRRLSLGTLARVSRPATTRSGGGPR